MPQIKVSLPKSSSSSKSSAKEVEEYVAAIDKYREALERLNRVQLKKSELELDLSSTDDLRDQIKLQTELTHIYRDEQDAILKLNELRSKTISEGADSLRQLGFNVEYDSHTNKFYVQNLERLNELVADSKGNYDSLQEATNALRKDTEDMIDTLESLNKENQDGTKSWTELRNSIRDSKIVIIDSLKQIVTDASNAVDEIQNVYSTLKEAADEFAADGFITIDVYQKIIDLGPQYMQYLEDGNGLLVINEERINNVIAAKTRQLAAEQALTYVERLRQALQEGAIENLDTLLYATTNATDATFGLAYAELELMHQLGDLDDNQYAAALHNIDAIRSLCETAVSSIGKVSGEAQRAAKEAAEAAKKELESLKDELVDMQDAGDDIIKYVMDMLRHRIQQQIDALEDMKDAYSEIISLKKESLRASKEENDYQKKISSKLKEMAKLQAKIEALSLDDSRDAQAERAKLLEQMAELQEDLSGTQADKAIEVAEDALDKMEDAYHEEKDEEIKILEDSISSTQKLYDAAISYIREHWNTLYTELQDWNYNYGTSLRTEIDAAWAAAQSAAERYGDFVTAIMGGISSEIDSITRQIEALNDEISNLDTSVSISASSTGATGSSGGNSNTIVGNTSSRTGPSNEDMIHSIIKQMYANMNEHGGSKSSTSAARKAELSQENLRLGAMLAQYGVSAYRSTDQEDLGTWYTDKSKSELLFEKYKKYIYHTGGIAGNDPTLKQNEIMAVLEKGEMILDKKKENGLYRIIQLLTTASDKVETLMRSAGFSGVFNITQNGIDSTHAPLPSVTNNQSEAVHFGDVYIYGANEETVKQHQEINRRFTNEVLSQLHIKR